MIHRASRDALALALRRYAARRISNDDLDAVEVDWRDRGATAVKQMAWQLYDDMYGHKAEGRHALGKETKRTIARWIVFLHSDLEYLWPEYSFMAVIDWPLNLLTLGWWKRRREERWRQFLEAGEFDAWPFLSRKEEQLAVRRPRFLGKHGARSN